jgi:DNA-directed RNA polymerase specialized sigma24 family protein
MTNEEALALQKRARNFAHSKGYGELGDDFAQEIFIGVARGWKQTVEQAFYSFLRDHGGDTRTDKGRARITGRSRTISLDAPVGDEGSNQTMHHDLIAAPPAEQSSDLPEATFTELLSGAEDLLYEKIFVDELSQVEVAHGMGLTPSRVCQLLKPIKKKLIAYGQLEELTERLESEPHFGVFEIEWISI